MNSRFTYAIACLSLSFAACAQEGAKPTITVDFEQQRHDRMLDLHRQELGVTTNQWSRFRDLLDEIAPFLDAARKEDSALWNDENEFAGAGHSIHFHMPTAELPAEYNHELARVVARLDAWRHRRFFELTAELARIEGVVPPPDVRGEPSHVKLTDLRALHRVQRTRMHVAADRDDDDDRLAAFSEILATNRTIVWFGGMVDWLVAESGVRQACEYLLAAHLRHPVTDGAWLDAADAMLARDAHERWLPSLALVEAIHESHLDTLQRTYTDDGTGDGVFLPDRYNEEFAFFKNALADYNGPFATRGEASTWLEHYVELLRSVSTATGQDYLEAEAAMLASAKSAGPRVPSAIDLDYSRMMHVLRKFEIRVAGTRVVLAIERYRLANDGAIPDSLDELGDLLPESLRTDPLSGEPWVYHAYPTSITEFGRDLLPGAKAWPYQLWSRALPGIEQATEWSSDPKNGVLITVPLQAPQYDAP